MLKRTLIAFFAAASLSGSAVVLASDSGTFPDGVSYSAPAPDSINALSEDPAPTCSADLSLGGYDVINSRTSLSSDAAPDASTLKPSQSAWSQATVNTTGAAAAVCGGVGRRFVTITAYTTSASDTLTIGRLVNASYVTTVLTAGTAFACQTLASNAECALALKTYLLANLPSGIETATCTDATCSDAKVFLRPTADCCNVTLTWSDAGGGGVAGTSTHGENGGFKVAPSSTLPYDAAAMYTYASSTTQAALWLASTNGTILGGFTANSGGVLVPNSPSGTGSLGGANVYAGAVCKSSGAYNSCTGSVIGLATDGIVSIGASTAKGFSTNIGSPPTSTQVLTCDGGGSATLVTSGLIPKGATLFGVSTRITSAGLTGPTSMDVGDGSDVDLYADDTAVTDNSTSGDAASTKIATANWGNPQLAAGEVTLTFNGGNCTAGTIRVTAHLATITAPTVD